jgi:rhamnosyltransferase
MISSITVTYNPDLKILINQIQVLLLCVDNIIIIDNHSENFLEFSKSLNSEKIRIISLTENKGIAYAQNIGLKSLINQSNETDYVLFFDHDSIPDNKFVPSMIYESNKLKNQGINLFLLGASYFDNISNSSSKFLVRNKYSFKKVGCQRSNLDLIKCNFLISSGSFIPIEVFKKVGLFREEFFIDHVDTDFCIRAENFNIPIYGNCNALMVHSLGDFSIKIWFGKKIPVPLNSNLRNYYMIRNSIKLVLYEKMDILWRIYIIKRSIIYIILSLIIFKFSLARIKMILIAIKDGFFNNGGKIKN